MKNTEFVRKLKESAGDDSVKAIIHTLESPRPLPREETSSDPIKRGSYEFILKQAIIDHTRSKWFHQLGVNEKQMLIELLQECAELTLFGALRMIDGVGNESEGVFEVVEVVGEECRLVNPQNTDMLHDLLSEVYAEDRNAGRV